MMKSIKLLKGFILLSLVCGIQLHAQVVPGEALGNDESVSREHQSASGTEYISNEALFGDKSEDSADTVAAGEADISSVPVAEKKSMPVPAGRVDAGKDRPIVLVIGRPNSFSYDSDIENTWIGALAELFFSFRLNAAQRVNVVSPERVPPHLTSYRDFGRRISRQKYLEDAAAMNATHLLYTEYEVRSSKQAVLHLSVLPVAQDAGEIQKVVMLDLSAINASLDTAVREVFLMLGLNAGEIPGQFLDKNIVGTNGRKARKLAGTLLIKEPREKEQVYEAAQQCEQIAADDPALYLAFFAGARLYAEAGEYGKAERLFNELLAAYVKWYPKLYLDASRYARRAGSFNTAMKLLDKITLSKSLESVVFFERALIYEARAEMKNALNQYSRVLELDPGDPEAHCGAAVAILALGGSIEDARTHLEERSKRTGENIGVILCLVGERLSKAGHMLPAIEAFKIATREMPENPVGWRRKAELEGTMTRYRDAAESWLGLFRSNQTLYREYLDRAAELFAGENMIDRAKEIYGEYLASNEDPAARLSLARLEFQSGNCTEVISLLDGLPPHMKKDEAVKSMGEQCASDTVPPVITLKGAGKNVRINHGEPWVDPGAVAVDNEDGEISGNVRVSGAVTTDKAGSYTIVYEVTDNAGNTARAERLVEVRPIGEAIPPGFNEALGKSSGRSGRPVIRIVVNVVTGIAAAGALAGGIYMDRMLGPMQQDYDAAADFDDVDRLHHDMEQTETRRNLLYIGSAVSAAGCALTVTIPRLGKNKNSRVAVGGVR